MSTRREFIKKTASGTVGISLGLNSFASPISSSTTKRPIHVFTKCLQFLNYQEMAEVLAASGFDGADLPVRPGGQVLPENVGKDLPKAVQALRDAGIDSKMIVTGINDPNTPAARSTFKVMANLGIKYYRMGYLNYDNKLSIPENLERHKYTFEKFEKVNREYGVIANYQNHSGTRVGGPVWDLYELLKDRDPDFIGVQYDIRHATIEGGISWPLGMKLLAPWIQTTDIKDFIWSKNEEGNWKVKNVPLGQGMTDFQKYFEFYKSFNIEAPVSIHYEYDLGGAEHGKRKDISMPREEIYSWLKKDIVFLKEQFAKYNL